MKPILFNTEMVRAILDGRKTVTRRVIKPQPSSGVRKSVFVKSGLEDGHGREIKSAYLPGDILYIRETWQEFKIKNPRKAVPEDFKAVKYIFKADGEIVNSDKSMFKWRPSIHMPKEAARIFLKVTGVRVERLHEMTQEDCIREGCGELSEEEFAKLWDGTLPPNKNKFKCPEGQYKTNPWVWVIDFEVINMAREVEMYVSVVTPKEGREIIETRSPLGLYMFVVKRKWIAVDNRTGDAWTEEFDNSREAMKWLLGEERDDG